MVKQYGGATIAHIPDGVLSAPVLTGGALAAAVLLAVATRRLDYDRIPQAAVFAAAFFVASLVNVPIGPGSVHLILNGLMGLILGWTAVPAILVALLMQALFFGYGGLLVLGVNVFNLALPALLCGLLLGPIIRRAGGRFTLLWGAVCGALGVSLTAGLVAVSLAASGPEMRPAAQLVLAAYVPLLIVESAVTAFAVVFIQRVSPDLIWNRVSPCD